MKHYNEIKLNYSRIILFETRNLENILNFYKLNYKFYIILL